MKKLVTISLGLVLSSTTLLAACSDKTATTSETPASTAAATQAATATPAPKKAEKPPIVNNGVIPAWDLSKNPANALARKDTMVIGLDAPEGVFSAIYGDSTYDQYVVNVIFDTLLAYKKDGTLEPKLAESYEVSPDGLTYTFKLNKNAKFSDGSPVTADDVAFTFTTLHDKSYDGPADISVDHIKGGDAYRDGKATSIEGIKVVDANTIQFSTTQVVASGLYDFGTTSIMSKAYYGKDYKQGDLSPLKNLNDKPMGSGPYILSKYSAGQEVILKANPNYFLGAPKTPNLIFKVTDDSTRMQTVQAGETDTDMITVSKDNVESLVNSGFLDINIYPTNGYGFIDINHTKPKFKDKRVIQALTYGLDRKQIVDAVFQGFADVINIPQSKQSWAYTEEGINKYEFNLDKAKQLLDEAGWKVGADGIREKDGEKFVINFVATTPNSVNPALIPVATENYKALGIKFIAEQMDFNAMQAKRKAGNFDMTFLATGLGADPDASTMFKTNGSQNQGKYTNPKVDQLLAEGLKYVDLDKRKPVYQQLYKEINDDPPFIFMYQRRDMWPINHRLQGFDLSPYKNFTWSIAKAQISQ
ncbi:ABC transporter substrate-binding protein [Paenibacillus sp. N1-5-1-14]|uniref:ABC transporter substrate-binding protein n=1 Tax=Paenibacillus radicibacter TaxID=2972488 RepID=UPI002159A21A|nr:ABC transporter substrate-binding protein [Paenibacillus radicibacter]MCR8641608.1 ABC transporter substrate-binding protein [Paenibacillus radicibacter]